MYAPALCPGKEKDVKRGNIRSNSSAPSYSATNTTTAIPRIQ